MYITANYQFLLSAHTEARNSEWVVVQQTPAYYFFAFNVKVWDCQIETDNRQNFYFRGSAVLFQTRVMCV